jgi:hypothetical protein
MCYLRIMQPQLIGIAALVLAAPGACNALVSLYDRFLAKKDGAVSLPVSGLAIRISNVLGLCLLAIIIAQTWFLPVNTAAISGMASSAQAPVSPVGASNGSYTYGSGSADYYDSYSETLPRSYIMWSVQKLWSSMCENHTQLQCDALMANVKDDWIAIEGTVGNISNGSVQVSVDKKRDVQCGFGDKSRSQFLTLHRNDRIRAAGQISGFLVGVLTLHDCELIGS